MARVLILSSCVAASRVGGGMQALALARLGVEPILIPTVLLGRHPGHGPPGGAAVEPAIFAAMIGGVEAQGLFARLDSVITGHFSSPEQVEIAAAALDRVRAAAPAARLVVDPIMGDDGRLYVREAVAEAIANHLVVRADLVAPNAWELGRLVGAEVSDAASAVAASRALGKPVLVSSVRAGGRIGALYADADAAWLATHPLAPSAPKGTGDLLTVLAVAALIGGFARPDALALAVGGVVGAIDAADGADELAVHGLPLGLAPSSKVRLVPLGG
ncbi:MAG TPA: bifunctional hydroxymethylpyrimidine kinase/phosphomethylpyrimidine kinase [Caulobacteraceae bacterium]|jgi:pyridoxine kinase|nr:bifunctional hydroxymethylpyrimidine kinase/phosphomethylpyrimidine kinase [Caulobacteraceae bacterium]